MSVDPADVYYTGEGAIQDEPQEYPGGTHLQEPIPVTVKTSFFAPEYGACMTWTLPVQGTNQPLQVLQRRIRRTKAKIEFTFPASGGTIIMNSNREAVINGVGYVVTVPNAGIYTFRDWENQQPLYAIATVGGVTCMTLDESYAER